MGVRSNDHQKVGGKQYFENEVQVTKLVLDHETVSGGAGGAITSTANDTDGTLSTTTTVSYLAVTTTSDNYHLGDGGVTGQVKYIIAKSFDSDTQNPTGSAEVHIDKFAPSKATIATASLSGSGASVGLVWNGSAWSSIGGTVAGQTRALNSASFGNWGAAG